MRVDFESWNEPNAALAALSKEANTIVPPAYIAYCWLGQNARDLHGTHASEKGV